MIERVYTVDSLLWHLLRGAPTLVPYVGDLLKELLFGPIDDHEKSQQAAKLDETLRLLKGQSKTLQEVLAFARQQAPLSEEYTQKLDGLTSVVSAASQGIEKDSSLREVKEAFRSSVEHNPLSLYLADLNHSLGLWRGLGLHRPVLIESIFVPISISKRERGRDQVLSGDELLDNLLSARILPPNILIEASAGSGKSTLLRHWAINLAERASWSLSSKRDASGPIDEYIPVFLPLSFVEFSCSPTSWNLSISDLAARRFPRLEDHLSRKLRGRIDQAIRSSRAVVLLDGADEVSEENRSSMKNWIEGVCSQIVGNPVVITSRPTGFVSGLGLFHTYSVRPFSRDDRTAFFERWFNSLGQPERVVEMKEFISQPKMFLMRGAELLGNPLFLTMMCIEFELTGTISRTPAELVERFTTILLRELDEEKGLPSSRYSLDLKRRVLETCASNFFEADRTRFRLGELVSCTQSVVRDSAYSFEPHRLLREIESRSGLLLEDRWGLWEFSHLLFQEFFAARFRRRLQMAGREQSSWLQKANYDDRYGNVMDFYAQLGELGP